MTLDTSNNKKLLRALQSSMPLLNNLPLAYIALNKQSQCVSRLVSNYPAAWLGVYRRFNYHQIDPVIQYGINQVAPFPWRKARGVTANHGDTLFSQSRHFQLSGGYTFILHDACGQFAALSLSNADQCPEFDTRIGDHAAQLQMVLIDVHQQALELPAAHGAHLAGGLSEREMTILTWVVRGKAYSEIAGLAGIVERTVKFHMSNIVRKLGVNTAKEAVFKATTLGLV